MYQVLKYVHALRAKSRMCILTERSEPPTPCTVSRQTVPFNSSEAGLIYSVNVVNFQWTVFISDFMHMREKTVCGFWAESLPLQFAGVDSCV